MKKKVSQTAQFSVVRYEDSNGGDYYGLYINGKWYNDYTSLDLITADMQALIMGVLPYDV